MLRLRGKPRRYAQHERKYGLTRWVTGRSS